MNNNHTFTAAGSLPDRFVTDGRYSELVLGDEDHAVFPATLRVYKINQVGSRSLLREFTEFPVNRSVRIETTPGSNIDIECTGSPDLYVELNNLTQ